MFIEEPNQTEEVLYCVEEGYLYVHYVHKPMSELGVCFYKLRIVQELSLCTCSRTSIN
jgi:hypothetical protein